jgi:hypothetical protein
LIDAGAAAVGAVAAVDRAPADVVLERRACSGDDLASHSAFVRSVAPSIGLVAQGASKNKPLVPESIACKNVC